MFAVASLALLYKNYSAEPIKKPRDPTPHPTPALCSTQDFKAGVITPVEKAGVEPIKEPVRQVEPVAIQAEALKPVDEPIKVEQSKSVEETVKQPTKVITPVQQAAKKVENTVDGVKALGAKPSLSERIRRAQIVADQQQEQLKDLSARTDKLKRDTEKFLADVRKVNRDAKSRAQKRQDKALKHHSKALKHDAKAKKFDAKAQKFLSKSIAKRTSIRKPPNTSRNKLGRCKPERRKQELRLKL